MWSSDEDLGIFFDEKWKQPVHRPPLSSRGVRIHTARLIDPFKLAAGAVLLCARIPHDSRQRTLQNPSLIKVFFVLGRWVLRVSYRLHVETWLLETNCIRRLDGVPSCRLISGSFIIVAQHDWSLEAGCRRGVVSEEAMSFEEGDCFQSWNDGGIFRSHGQLKSFLRF